MPDDLTRPGNRHAGEEVDVMSFLNIKRAQTVVAKNEGGLTP